MVKKCVILLILMLHVILLSACAANDDFAPYENNTFDVSIDVDGNIFVISEIEDEITAVANEYASEASLAYVKYTFFGENHGEILFNYKYNYERDIFGQKIGYTKIVDVFIDIFEKKIDKVVYEDGITKRVGGYGGNYVKNKDVNSLDLYLDTYSNMINKDNIEYVSISYLNDEIKVNGFDKNNRVVDHASISSTQ